ncbi:Hypothetical predicted protein [Podarcis lilfordi]|uniref:Uncharacterized protein n=1 Tax=Podarcis lilfordi TaxID=74358 RepID=A0AA35LGN3_9SAUR|nr:Hypothetical predicted protein [Podarcis lilfordi]
MATAQPLPPISLPFLSSRLSSGGTSFRYPLPSPNMAAAQPLPPFPTPSCPLPSPPVAPPSGTSALAQHGGSTASSALPHPFLSSCLSSGGTSFRYLCPRATWRQHSLFRPSVLGVQKKKYGSYPHSVVSPIFQH